MQGPLPLVGGSGGSDDLRVHGEPNTEVVDSEERSDDQIPTISYYSTLFSFYPPTRRYMPVANVPELTVADAQRNPFFT
jgi:hypothetical protein